MGFRTTEHAEVLAVEGTSVQMLPEGNVPGLTLVKVIVPLGLETPAPAVSAATAEQVLFCPATSFVPQDKTSVVARRRTVTPVLA
jgi:hypothetical protein